MIHSALFFTAPSVICIHRELHSHGITHSLICMEMSSPGGLHVPELIPVLGREGKELCRAEGQTPEHPSALGGWQEAGDGFLLPSSFSSKTSWLEQRTKYKLFIPSRILGKTS